MSDKVERAVEVWCLMQRDPEMLSGLTVGDIEDLMEGACELVAESNEIRRSLPLTLMLDMNRPLENTGQMAEKLTAFLKLPLLRKALDALAGKSPR